MYTTYFDLSVSEEINISNQQNQLWGSLQKESQM